MPAGSIPARLARLALASRYPERPRRWLLERPGVPVCLACFEADVTAGCDSYLRSDWRLAEHVACPTHGDMLRDRCPVCSGNLRVSFRMRGGLLRPFCRKCDTLLTSRGGEAEHPMDVGFVEGVLDLQRKVQGIVRVTNPTVVRASSRRSAPCGRRLTGWMRPGRFWRSGSINQDGTAPSRHAGR